MSASFQAGGWRALVVAMVVVVLWAMFWPLPVADLEPCRTCAHGDIHHRGTCQACLRQVRDHAARPDVVPCWRFARSSPVNRWVRLRSGEGLGAVFLAGG